MTDSLFPYSRARLRQSPMGAPTGGMRAVAVAVMLVAALTACDDKKSDSAAPANGQKSGGAAAPAPEVTTVTITPQAVSLTSELPGRVSAFRMAEVRPQVSGIVQKRLFQEGGDVKAGQQLYQIDPAPYQAAVDSAKAALDKAQANLKSVQAKAARYQDLVKISAVSHQDYDDIVASQEQSRADVTSARAALDTAKINLDYTRVFSPISGRIGKSSVTEGALVTANQTTALATVQQLDPVYVDITQSSAQLIQLKRDIAQGRVAQAAGQQDKAGAAAQAAVSLKLEGDSQTYAHKGLLQFSDVTVDESTGAVQLRALFPNPEGDLLPGLFVRATVEQGVRDNALVVPQQAVMRSADGSASVWVVNPDNTVMPRPVKTVQAIGDKWLISEGLQGGEQVVIEGVMKIRPGASVRPSPVGAPAGSPAGAPAAAGGTGNGKS